MREEYIIVDWDKLNNTDFSKLTEEEKERLEEDTNLYYRFDQLSSILNPDNFCSDCECTLIDHNYEEFWGMPCCRDEPACDCGDEETCGRATEYNELVEEYEQIYNELKSLYGDDFTETCDY